MHADGAAAANAPAAAASPNCLLGLVVRFKFGGRYVLRPLYGLVPPLTTADGDGQQQQKQFVWVGAPSPDPATRGVVAIPAVAVSGTNPLEGQLSEAAGSAEVAELGDWLRARQQTLPLSMAAAAAVRKQAVLRWWAQHQLHTEGEQLQHLPQLLAELGNEASIQLAAHSFQLEVPELGQQSQQPVAGAAAAAAAASAADAGKNAGGAPAPNAPEAAARVADEPLAAASAFLSGVLHEPREAAAAPAGAAAQAAAEPPACREQAALWAPQPGGSGATLRRSVVSSAGGLRVQLRQAPPELGPDGARQPWLDGHVMPGSGAPPQDAVPSLEQGWNQPGALPNALDAALQGPENDTPDKDAGVPRAAGSNDAPTCELRLPGVRSVREALSLLRPAIRRAVPAEEPASAAKRAALGALLESGLHQRGSGDAFWQEGIHMAHVGVKLLKAMDSDPVLMEQYRRYSKMSQFLHSFRDTTLLEFSTVGASGYWLLRVDHLAAVHAGVSERQLEGSLHRRSRRGSPLHRGRRRSPSTGRRRHSRSRSESGSRTRRRRDSSPGRRAVQSRSRSRSTGRWEGAQRRGRPRFRSRSPVGRRSAGLAARCSARGDGSTSVFWDPVWRTERQLVRQLDVRGPMRPEDLLAAVDWPPQLDRMDAEGVALFLRRRPGLVQLLQDGRAAAAGRAADLLQYKRDLLQYMADRPPRVSLDELQAAVPTPQGLLSDLACTSLYNFLRTHLADVVWLRRSNSPVPSMVELRPWELARRDATLPGAPRPPRGLQGLCRSPALPGWSPL
ncbi:hypothetical protein ABPG77_004231 [Micractinium sp. CCAP 211/92]